MVRWIKKITELLRAANSNQMHFMGSRMKTRFSCSCYKTVKMALLLPQRLYKRMPGSAYVPEESVARCQSL
jgi:hypothetical protein